MLKRFVDSKIIVFQIFCSAFFLMFTHLNQAQQTNNEVWFGYISSIQLKKNFSLWNDFHFVNQSFIVVRPGLTYNAKNNYKFTAGVALVKLTIPATRQFMRNENRLWWQVEKTYQLNQRFIYRARFRYDARFKEALSPSGKLLKDENRFNHRLRVLQNFRYTFPHANPNQRFHLNLTNEILVNATKNTPVQFDQIRNYVLLGFTRNQITFLSGYHQRWIPFIHQNSQLNHGFTIWIIHNINFEKK